MIDAYTIGIKLALEDGVSAGIAAIRQDLATLDRAIESTAAGLIALRRLGQQVSLVTRDDAQPAPANVPPAARPTRAAIAPAPVAALSADKSFSDPTPHVPEVRVFPDINVQAAVAPRSREQQRPPLLPGQPLTIGTRAPAALPPNRHPTIVPDQPRSRSASEFAPAMTPVAARVPAGAPPGPSPLVEAAAAVSTATQASPAAASIGSTGGSMRAGAFAPLRDSGAASPGPRPGHVEAPRAWSDYAASTHDRSDPVRLPRTHAGDMSPTRSRSDHAPPAVESEPRPSPNPLARNVAARHAWAGTAPRHAGSDDGHAETLPRAAPPGRDEAQSAGFSGDIVMDGARLGRWLTDGLTRMTERPPSGSTGVDPRATPGWPGMHGD